VHEASSFLDIFLKSHQFLLFKNSVASGTINLESIGKKSKGTITEVVHEDMI
jgi:hypothetical protein